MNTLAIGKISKSVIKLLEDCKKVGIEVDKDIIEVWISEASDYDCISKSELMNINRYIIDNGNDIDTLIEVYSYLNSTIDMMTD